LANENEIKDVKLRELYDFFKQFNGVEEFYVGDIIEYIEIADKGKLNCQMK